MRLLQRTGFAVTTVLLLATPTLAQEAGDCDMLCRLKGYLTTDHMAGDRSGEAPPAAPAKTRRSHAAAAHKPASSPKAVAANLPAPTVPAHKATPAAHVAETVAAPAKPETTAPRKAPVRTALVPPAPAARPVKPAPAKAVAAAMAAPTPVDRPPPPATPPKLAEDAHPAPQRSAAARRRVAAQARAIPASQPTQTASLATSIPGSAPAMQAGFH